MTAKEIIRSGCTIISYDKNKNGGLGSGSPVFINVNNDYKLIGTLFSCIDRTEKIEKIAFDGYRIKDTYAIIPTPLNVCIKNNILLQLLQI